MGEAKRRKEQQRLQGGIVSEEMPQKSLEAEAQHQATLIKSLDVDAVRAWARGYVKQYGEKRFRRLIDYVSKHYPEEWDIYYTQVVLPDLLLERGISPASVTITRFTDSSGRRKTRIVRK